MFEEVVKREWPRLVREICQDLALHSIVKEDVNKTKWEKIMKQAARDKHDEDLKEEFGSKPKRKE